MSEFLTPKNKTRITMNTNPILRFLILILAPLLMLSLFTACSDDNGITDPDNGDAEQNLVELAQDDDRFTTLVQLILDAELEGTLSGDEFTVFAPTNAAFDALFDVVDPADLTTEDIIEILTFHVTGGTILSGDLSAQQDVEMLNEERTLVQVSAAGVLINGSSTVIEADLVATNGVIHAIDEVLLPSAYREPNLVDTAREAGDFEVLLSLAEDVGLITTLKYLGPYTAFAPNDEAFAALFAEIDPDALSPEQVQFILTYHVIAGAPILSGDLSAQQTVDAANNEPLYITADNGDVTVNGSSNVIAADVTASNGVIHVVDQVLLPNAFLNTVEVAAKNYNFTTLVGLLSQYPDLVDAVATSEITVFAPTNDAFDTLFESVDPNDLTEEQIAEVLLYHTILGAQVFSDDLAAEQTVESGSEEALYITADAEGVVVNGSSNVVLADVASTNGVIHAIDSVLLPNAFLDITGIALKNYNLTTLVGLLADFDLVETLQGEGKFTVFAPTNEAFDDISSVLPDLTNDQIESTLLYHVLGAEVFAGDLAATQTVEMLNEQDVTITVANGTVTIEADGSTAVVTVADLGGTNGVIHIVDTVLIPSLD
ncbi:MAG: fasciclin domain-containing protein [Balneolaceae bacterium]|nr:MAG: fasciclin domain-containing protein [Balneolaceae bacterium]